MDSKLSGAALQRQSARILEAAERLNQAVQAPEVRRGEAPPAELVATLARQLQADVVELATMARSPASSQAAQAQGPAAAGAHGANSACRVLEGMAARNEQSRLKQEGLKEGYAVKMYQPREKGFLNGLRGDLCTTLELDKPEQLQWAAKLLAEGKAQLDVCFWKEELTPARGSALVQLYTGETTRKAVNEASSAFIKNVDELLRYAELNHLPR